MKLVLSENNSGGSWWLDDEDWFALEAAGWIIDWYASREDSNYTEDRFLGALAGGASKEVANSREANEAVEDWERITHQDASSSGCSCCGQPHYFSLYEEVPCEKCVTGNKCYWCDDTGLYPEYVSSFEVEEVRYKKGF